MRSIYKRVAAIGAALTLGTVAVLASAPAAAAAPAAAPAAVTAAAPASVEAGNGTSNFYYSRSCGVDRPLGAWSDISWTNYDNGANQTIHWTVRTSGAAITWQIYVNGVLKKSGTGYNTGYISWPGWGKVVVLHRAWVPGFSAGNCSASAP